MPRATIGGRQRTKREYADLLTQEWNASLVETLAWADKLPFYVVPYETFFAGHADLEELADFTGLDASRLGAGYETMLKVAKRLVSERAAGGGSVPSPPEWQYLSKNGNFEAYRKVLELAPKSKPRLPPPDHGPERVPEVSSAQLYFLNERIKETREDLGRLQEERDELRALLLQDGGDATG